MLMEEWFTDGYAVQVPAGTSVLDAELQLPTQASGLILLAHAGSGKQLQSRIQGLPDLFSRAGYATLRVDLLTEEEAEIDGHSEATHFDLDMLAERLNDAVEWVLDLPEAANLPLGLFGSGNGAEAIFTVAAARTHTLAALVAAGIGAVPDAAAVRRIPVPVLLVAAEKDDAAMNAAKVILQGLPGRKRLEVLNGAASLENSMDKTARLACLWFEQYLV